MDLNTYQTEAMRTESDPDADVAGRLMPTPIRLIHSVLGLLTECGEISEAWIDAAPLDPPKAHLAEELGDVLWYVAVGADAAGMTLRDLSDMRTDPQPADYTNTIDQLMGIVASAGRCADPVKRYLFYRQDLDVEAIRAGLADVLWDLDFAAAKLETTIEAIAEANIAKLRARYPAGFTAADAAEDNRDRAAEAAAADSSTP